MIEGGKRGEVKSVLSVIVTAGVISEVPPAVVAAISWAREILCTALFDASTTQRLPEGLSTQPILNLNAELVIVASGAG
jgi:hypothetical protein